MLAAFSGPDGTPPGASDPGYHLFRKYLGKNRSPTELEKGRQTYPERQENPLWGEDKEKEMHSPMYPADTGRKKTPNVVPCRWPWAVAGPLAVIALLGNPGGLKSPMLSIFGNFGVIALAFAQEEPSATEEIKPASEVSRIVLRAGELLCYFEKLPQGVRLQRVESSSLQRVLLGTSSLFRITLRHLPSGEIRSLGADTGWQDIQVTQDEAAGAVEIRWGNPGLPFPPELTAIMRVEADAEHSALRWWLEVTGGGEEHSLWTVTFPVFALPEPSPDAVLLYPKAPGVAESGLWRRPFQFGGRYPSGWVTMQLTAVYPNDGSGGIYVGLHDPRASTKEMMWRSEPEAGKIHFSVEHPLPDMGRVGASFRLPGVLLTQFLRGSWFDAAQIYRRWAEKEALWWPEIGSAGRQDTPLWMRELPLWILTGGAPEECSPAVLRFRQFMDLPCGFHWYNWHQIPFDNDYPHYFPTKEGFAEGVKFLQESGVHVMPYINGRLWDTRDRGLEDYQFTAVALPAATKNHAGEPFVETYGSKEKDGSHVQLAVMCPTTSLWHGKVAELVSRLFQECGTHAVYIDQVAAAPPTLCADSSHGHPLGGGHWWTEGYWALLERIRREKPAHCMITTECNAEPFIRWFDGYLTWHWQYDNQVPLFPAVYAGTIQMFGRWFSDVGRREFSSQEELDNHNKGVRMRLAQALVFGEQLGWIPPQILEESENAGYLRQLAQVRWELREYFYAGKMGRPPQLHTQVAPITADWKWQGKSVVTLPAILTAQWLLPSKQRGVVLGVNMLPEPVPAILSANLGEGISSGKGKENFLIPAARVITCRPAQIPTGVIDNSEWRVEVTFPGLTAYVWEFSLRSE